MVASDNDERARRAQSAYSEGSRRRTILLFGALVGLVFVVAGGVTAGIAVRRNND
jgi:hypothetical protein